MAQEPKPSRREFLSRLWNTAKTAAGVYVANALLDPTELLFAQTTQPTYLDVTTLPLAPQEKRTSREYQDLNVSGNPLYDVRKSGDLRISQNFKLGEFTKSGGVIFDFARIDPKILEVLQSIRTELRKPMVITSGYRSFSHNRKIHGSRRSRHMSGDAADFYVPGVRAYDLADLSAEVLKNKKIRGGIGTYQGQRFIHVDTRGRDARWGPHIAPIYTLKTDHKSKEAA